MQTSEDTAWRGLRGGARLMHRAQGSFFAAACLTLLAACQSTPPTASGPPAPESPYGDCHQLFERTDQVVGDSAASRSFPHRIAGFPYLRSTRTLASFADDLGSDAEISAWLGHLAAADADARRSELQLLTVAQRAVLPALPAESLRRLELDADAALETVLDACRRALLQHDQREAGRLAQLRRDAAPGSEYSRLQRVAGLYPITSLGVRAGVARWHREVLESHARADEDTAPAGVFRRYAPAPRVVAAPGGADKAETLETDALGIPTPGTGRLDDLFTRHAPVWQIDTLSDADRPGAPLWKETRRLPGVDPDDAVVYRYTSITRFRGRPRLQLNYLVWFDARPSSGLLDMLAGPLDGVIWRVTLDSRGEPLIYDSVHACGCYHLFFPLGDVVLRDSAERLPEPPLVPRTLPLPAPDTRVHLRISAGAHYLEGVRHAPVRDTDVTYRFAEREALYAVPTPDGGRESLFREDGLVAGSQRPERWFLWPTGVRSPGAMRERGRRATAFVGERHFDDPFLFDTLFR